MTVDYGTDLRCVLDADALFSAVSGLDVVRQDLIHRILTDAVLGNDDWGYDVRRLHGIPQHLVSQYAPVLEEVLTRDPRVSAAKVVLTVVKKTGALSVAAAVSTVRGVLSFVVSVSQTPSGSFHVEA